MEGTWQGFSENPTYDDAKAVAGTMIDGVHRTARSTRSTACTPTTCRR